MTHLEQRLNERGIKINQGQLIDIAKTCNTSTAVLIAKSESCNGDTSKAYRQRESNGELVVLIVRNNYPVTIMFRRLNQPWTPSAMGVNELKDYSTQIH